MADDHHRPAVPVTIALGDERGDLRPGIPGIDIGAIALGVQLAGKVVHAEREHAEQPAHQIDMGLERFGGGGSFCG